MVLISALPAFSTRKHFNFQPNINFTAPGGGVLVAKNGGHWRVFKGIIFSMNWCLQKIFRAIFLQNLAGMEIETPRYLPAK